MKAVVFDFFGVLEDKGKPNEPLLSYIRKDLYPQYKLGVISNSTSDFLHEILSKADAEMFQEIVLSYQVGLVKPDPEIYELALKRLGVKASEAVFIDDIESFCQAARQVGMQAVVYTDFDATERELQDILATDSNN